MNVKGFYICVAGQYDEIQLKTGDYIEQERGFLYFFRANGDFFQKVMVMFQLPCGELKCEPGIVALSDSDVEDLIHLVIDKFSLTVEKVHIEKTSFRYDLYSQGESPMEVVIQYETLA